MFRISIHTFSLFRVAQYAQPLEDYLFMKLWKIIVTLAKEMDATLESYRNIVDSPFKVNKSCLQFNVFCKQKISTSHIVGRLRSVKY
jgi:hypothetical protein